MMKEVKLSWINEDVSNLVHNNLMHNALYSVEVITKSLKRANALEVVRQSHDAGYITDEQHKALLNDMLNREGFEGINFRLNDNVSKD